MSDSDVADVDEVWVGERGLGDDEGVEHVHGADVRHGERDAFEGSLVAGSERSEKEGRVD